MLCALLSACKGDEKKQVRDEESLTFSSVTSPQIIADINPLNPFDNIAVSTIPASQPLANDNALVEITDLNLSLYISPSIKNAPDWISGIGIGYKAMYDCATAYPDESAFISNITPDHQNLRIEMTGHDGYGYECLIDPKGGPPLSLSEKEPYITDTTLFFFAIDERPKLNNPECFKLEMLRGHPKKNLGWIAYPLQGCTPTLKDEH